MTALHAHPQPELQIEDSAPETDALESDRERLYRAVIGENNTDYYLDQFMLIDQPWKGKSAWNWPAMTMTFAWLVHRKMWVHAVCYFLLPYAGMVGLSFLTMQMQDEAQHATLICAALYFLFLFGVLPKIANAQYHALCRRKLKRAAEVATQLQDQEAWLIKHGGTASLQVVGIVSALAIFATTAGCEWLRTIGERRIAVQTICLKVQSVAQGVSAYYSYSQLLPETLKDIGTDGLSPEGVSKLAYNARNGIINVTLAIPGLEGKHLRWTPTTPQYIELQWRCSSPDVSDFYLPPACQAHPHPTISQ